MSNLLSQASLVMIPSGYKEDIVYSQIPTSGAGDLSFTRASNGTRINSAGLVEVCPWNLLQYSEDFTNTSIWTQDAAGTGTISVTANYGVAPNGTTTADRVQMTKGSIYTQIYQTMTVISGAQYTLSVYLKSLSGTPTITTLYNTAVAGTKTLTTEWVRYDFTFIAASSTIYPMIALYGSDSASMDVLAWGYQLNIGSTAKPYFPTTDRLNVPRLTYQNGGGGCPSLLLEKQSTNLATYSEQLDNAAWIKLNGSVTANIAVSPDGTSNADAFIPNTTSGVHALRSNLFNQSATASHSWFVKANGYTKIAVRESELVGNYATFNLTTGTLISTNQTGSIQNLGNGWYRCTLVDTTTGVNAQTSIVVLPDSYTSGDPIVVNWSGDGTQGVFAWGAQVELSSYPTSYIPTTSASATRVADACFKTGISSLIGQTEGVLFVDLVWNNPIEDVVPLDITGSDGKLIWMRGIGAQFYGNGTTLIVNIGVNGAVQGTRYKIAFLYGANDFKLYRNGALIGTDTSGTFTGSFSDIALNAVINQSNLFNQVVLFKTKLTDAELIALTTI